MPSDTTYLFFQRELENGDSSIEHRGPTMKTPRIITSVGSRAGSVPPMHFALGSTRATSVQPLTASSSSVRIRPVAGQTTISGTRSRQTMSDIGKDGQVIVRRVLSPSSDSSTMSRSHGPSSIHRSSGTASGSHLYRRASIAASTAGAVGLRGDNNKQCSSITSSGGLGTKRSSVYFPSSQASYGRTPASIMKIRRASISGASPSASAAINRLPASSQHHTVTATTSTKQIHNDVDNNHPKKKIDYGSQFDLLLPWQKESITNLRARTQVARDQLSRHRVLLDRYLPINLGPEQDVKYEVESKYGELLSRMPQLEHKERRQKRDDDDYTFKIEPYRPASVTRAPLYGLTNVSVSNSFTPKVSDTRKRARSVLCKVKGDPNYFNYQ